MIARHLTLISLIISTNALSIGTVSEKNVTKRETNLGDLFPDWVPFKNKHGEELGEFVQVKNKPKKRLAPPINFILKAVAEPKGDDYYEKDGGGGSDSENYEKKDSSDTNGPVLSNEPLKPQNHTEISEIDGVVNIITQRPTNPVVEALKKANQNADEVAEAAQNEESKEGEVAEKGQDKEGQERKTLPENRDINTEDSSKKAGKYEDEAEYEDDAESSENRKPEPLNEEQERSESESEKKVRILNTVDELKERHAKEQEAISEKAKEEEMYKEERERDNIQAQLSLDSDTDKYDDKPQKPKEKYSEYDEYDEKEEVSLSEKYRPRDSPERTKPTTTQSPKQTTKQKELKDKKIESGKLSVFKNPQLYMIYDDASDEATTTTTVIPKFRQQNSIRPSTKFSAKYASTSANGDSPDRISLVPEESESKEGEPALFFPKKRKNKKNKNRFTTAPDVKFGRTEPEKKVITSDTTGTDTTGSDSIIVDTTIETGPSGSDIVPTHTDQVTDAIPASTQHHKEPEIKVENYHREKGGAREHHSEHEEDHSEEGKKAYEGIHKETKSSKGHHDKENHLGKYDDHGGVDAHHEVESGHYGDHHHEEHGKKHAKYEESGKHSKGHSTKGSHDIHKKEEYEKKVEFFEEEGDSGEEEKHGGFNEEHGSSQGGHFKNGNSKAGHEQHAKGESGHFAKGGHLHVSKGHKQASGHDGHGNHGHSHHQNEGKDSGKKWVYHHGYPAKTANLILIDRRADQLYHGPQYYG